MAVERQLPARRGVILWRFEASEGALMSNNLFVGNLAFDTSTADLESLFSAHGEVSKAQVITDRDSGRSRGFGFVEMATADAAQAAIDALDGHSLDGRQLTVNVAKERSR
jgi:RNA recognition motif-containing protein